MDEVGETVSIAVLREPYAVSLHQVRGPGAVGSHSRVGQLTHVHATSSGKIPPAHLPAQERARVLAASGLKKLTPHTLTAGAKLEKDLTGARERGYAVTPEELEIGLHAMAAPIRSRDGEVIAAVSASGPAYRFTEERLHALAPALLKGAQEISHRMGYPGRAPSRPAAGATRRSRRTTTLLDVGVLEVSATESSGTSTLASGK